MVLAESLIWALSDQEIGGIKVYCDVSLVEKVGKSFMETFETEWGLAHKMVETEYGDCYLDVYNSGYRPVSIENREYGLFISVGALDIKYNWGNFCDLNYGIDALDNALETIKEQYPTIEYEGFCAFTWSDLRCGDVVQYEVSSKGIKRDNDTVYDFVGEAIARELENDDYWEELGCQLEDGGEKTFLEVAESLYAYKDWIGQDNLERAVNRIIDIMSEEDVEIREALETVAKRMLAGEKVERETDTDDNLPDGYMEALDMFLKAQEMGAPKPKRGEVVSSEGTFDIVIAKAEEGDLEAKFTAGKYFIADHIEEEYERAITWIKEAAEAGIEEAIAYVDKNSDLFDC